MSTTKEEFEATYPEAMNRSDRVGINTADMRYYEESKMTRTGERFDSLANRIDRLIANTDRKLRVVETMALGTVPKVSLIAMLFSMELTLTAWMTHPVIIPSPLGIECSEALRKGINRMCGRGGQL